MITGSNRSGHRPRASWWLYAIVAVAVETVVVAGPEPASAAGGPTVDVWYGDQQSFGQVGTPQKFVNVLGNVSDGVASLSYSLNGGAPSPLSIGPDNRRLEAPGDFNVDLPVSALDEGPNTVVIRAVDGVGDVATETVTVDYSASNEWPLPYTVDWSAASEVNDAAQVVDGKWELTPGGLRTTEIGYDRLVAVGDTGWQDYEVTVPITVHSIGEGGIYSGDPMVGVLMRWQGHTDDPWAGQPLAGYRPNGNIGIWRGGKLGWYAPSGRSTFAHQLGVTYTWKLRVKTNTDGSSTYWIKAWPNGSAEPSTWWRDVTEASDDLASGSLLLLAHHMDVTFGDVNVTPIGGGSSTFSVSTSTTGSGSVSLDPPGGSYTSGTAVTATASPAAGWKFVGWSGDLSGSANPAALTINGNKSVTAMFGPKPDPGTNPDPEPDPDANPQPDPDGGGQPPDPASPPSTSTGVFGGMMPTRLVDTRRGMGGEVQGHDGVIRLSVGRDPAALNLTAVQPTGSGHFVTYPCADGAGTTSSVNWTTADSAVANMVLATPDRNGEVCVKAVLPTGGQVHMIVDRTGSLYTDGGFVGAAAKRLRDSRDEGGKLAAGATMRVTALTPDVGAILNLTVAQPESAGHLTAYPCAEGRPTASVSNYRAGQAKANMTIVRADRDGAVCVDTHAGTHLVVDHVGAIAASGATEFVTPTRLSDSRSQDGKRATYAVTVPDAAGRAAILSVTAAQSTGPGHATVHPCGGSVPTASTVNFAAGQTVANHVVIAPNANGRVCVTTVGDPHIIVDLAGYLDRRG